MNLSSVEWITPSEISVNGTVLAEVYQQKDLWSYRVLSTHMTDANQGNGYRTMIEAKIGLVKELNNQGIY